jgi:hypothetical protein
MQVFIKIQEIGIQSEKGRIGHSVSGLKKQVALPDRPLALAGPIIRAILDFAEWPTRKAAEHDLNLLKEFVADLKIEAV